MTEPRETKGEPPGRSHRLYVIHKHAATRLHYDFRLELDGVLLSWAIPKGPSLDPSQKRLAVRVEDHPLDYGSFEGTIPHGEYGGGTVMLWDRGHWQPEGDPHEGIESGTLRFELFGTKLRGLWKLVRMRTAESAENWLLIKSKDAHARSLAEGDILRAAPHSVATGRTMEQIAKGE